MAEGLTLADVHSIAHHLAANISMLAHCSGDATISDAVRERLRKDIRAGLDRITDYWTEKRQLEAETEVPSSPSAHP